MTPAPNGCSAGVPIYNYSPAGSTTCTAFLWDPVANKPSTTTTTIQDSNAQGYACRHNNQVYAVSGAPAAGGPFTYPRTSLGDVYAANKTGVAPYTQTGAFINPDDERLPDDRHNHPHPAPLLHDRLDPFCDNIDITVNGQWRGFGAGVCKPTNDLTQYQNVQYGQFHRVGLRVGHGRLSVHRPGHGAAVDAHTTWRAHQLRELVRLLPASRALCEDDVLARVQPARRHIPRRLPHARSGAAAGRPQPRDQRPRLGRRRRFHAGRRETEEPVVERAVRGPHSHQRQDAVAVRDAADRQPVRDGRCRRAPAATSTRSPRGRRIRSRIPPATS